MCMFVEGYSNTILKDRIKHISSIIVHTMLSSFADDSTRSLLGIYDLRMVSGDICTNVRSNVHVGLPGARHGNTACKCQF